jgi:hypothetical protein
VGALRLTFAIPAPLIDSVSTMMETGFELLPIWALPLSASCAAGAYIVPVIPCMALPLKVRALALARSWKMRIPEYVPVVGAVRLIAPLPLRVILPYVPVLWAVENHRFPDGIGLAESEKSVALFRS